MVLTMDIGNTNVTLGGFSDGELCFVSRLSTDSAATADEYAVRILNTLSLYRIDCSAISAVMIASVVPHVNTAFKHAVEHVFSVSPRFVEPGIKTGLGIQCDMPSSVGADMICACVAANACYGKPSLIVDIGTATKIMLVNDRGAFVGVSIMPGVLMGARALAAGTAQLPNVELEAPNSVIGKNTVDCMKSGVIYGHASMIDGMIDRIYAERGEEIPVCVTGGLAPLLLPYCKHAMAFDEHLILKGLYLIYGKNK